MHNDINDSIKARLYDMKYTPFLASYVFFFVYFNAKLFLIFFDLNFSVQNKIDMLSYDMINYLYPVIGALIYTLIFPLVQAGFYYVALQYRRFMNFIQQQIQDKTPLLQEKANEILRENANLQLDLDKKIEELDNVKKRFETKEQSLVKKYEEKTKELENSFSSKLEKEIEKLKYELIEAQKKVSDRGEEIEQLKKQVTNSETKVNKTPKNTSRPIQEKQKNDLTKILEDSQNKQNEEFQKLIASLDEDEKIILKSFFETDSKINKNSFKDWILKNKQMQKVTAEKAIHSLVGRKVVLDQYGEVSLTELGLRVVDELFR